jgi:hypothetical protein
MCHSLSGDYIVRIVCLLGPGPPHLAAWPWRPQECSSSTLLHLRTADVQTCRRAETCRDVQRPAETCRDVQMDVQAGCAAGSSDTFYYLCVRERGARTARIHAHPCPAMISIQAPPVSWCGGSANGSLGKLGGVPKLPLLTWADTDQRSVSVIAAATVCCCPPHLSVVCMWGD